MVLLDQTTSRATTVATASMNKRWSLTMTVRVNDDGNKGRGEVGKSGSNGTGNVDRNGTAKDSVGEMETARAGEAARQ